MSNLFNAGQKKSWESNDNKFTFIDLFAGIGGFRIGLEMNGGKCVFSSEWDKNSQLTYSTNFGSFPEGDITKIDEKGNSFHDKDPDKAHLIVKMFELYATGNHSVKTIRDITYDLGLRSKAGKKLSPSMAHKMIKDKFYIGTMTSKGVEYPHIYPRIVSKELFKKVQDILASHKKQPHKKASKPFVFRGIIKCKKCGCSISPELKKGKYVYYSCSNYKGICKRVFVREEDLLKPIQKLMESIQMPEERMNVIVDDLKSFTQNKNQFHERMVKQIQKEYNEIQDNLDNLIDLLVSRRITQDIYDKKLKQYKNKQNDLNTQLQEYTNADEKYHIVASTVFSLANRALEIFESSEPNEKRQLLNFLVQNCLLSGKNLEFSIRSPFNLIQETAHHSIGLALQDDFRQIQWRDIFPHPEIALRQTKAILIS